MILGATHLTTIEQRIEYFESVIAQIRLMARPNELEAVSSGYIHELNRMKNEVAENEQSDQAGM